MSGTRNQRRKVLLLHNFYQQPGGEDQVFRAENALLEEYGHETLLYTLHNDSIGARGKLSLAKDTVWNSRVYDEIRSLIRREKPDIAHFHNTFPLISPSAYYAARAEGVPVVQTLHNYRLVCLNALLFRDRHLCEDCLKHPFMLPGVMHSCYRNSRSASAVAALSQNVHRTLGTFEKLIDAYITLTEFSREKLIEGPVPQERAFVKPNFLNPDPGIGEGRGDYFLFVGRLDSGKGIKTLLETWRRLSGKVRVKIVGDGEMGGLVEEASGKIPGVEWLGTRGRDEVISLMKDARALIFPSIWYEGFPMVIVEALATGLPVLASDTGSMSSLIIPGVNGLHHSPGNPEELARNVLWTTENPEEFEKMRQSTRETFEASYTAGANYRRLMEIYDLAEGRVG